MSLGFLDMSFFYIAYADDSLFALKKHKIIEILSILNDIKEWSIKNISMSNCENLEIGTLKGVKVTPCGT